MKRRPVRILLAALAIAAAAGGCGGPAARSKATPATGALPLPVNAVDPATLPSAAPAPNCGDPRASLRPVSPKPAPGAMPAGSTMAEIAKRGRLVVGIDQVAYLLGYRDPNSGQLVGFEIELGREIARDLFGNPDAVQFRAITTAQRIPAVQNHDVDLVIRTMTMNCERWQQVSFSTEYLSSHTRLLVNRASGITGFEQLGGRKVCATSGSTTIRTVANAPSHPIPVGTDNTLDCLVMLQQGQVDALASDDTVLAGLVAQDPNTAIVGPLLSSEPSGIAVHRDSPDLVRFVNQVLERLRADGTWQRLYDRWLAVLGPTPPPPARYRD